MTSGPKDKAHVHSLLTCHVENDSQCERGMNTHDARLLGLGLQCVTWLNCSMPFMVLCRRYVPFSQVHRENTPPSSTKRSWCFFFSCSLDKSRIVWNGGISKWLVLPAKPSGTFSYLLKRNNNLHFIILRKSIKYKMLKSRLSVLVYYALFFITLSQSTTIYYTSHVSSYDMIVIMMKVQDKAHERQCAHVPSFTPTWALVCKLSQVR